MKVRTYVPKKTRNHTGFRVLRTVVGALGTGGGALVAGVTRDTHDCGFCTAKAQMVSLLDATW